jgi:hypothetical protein
MHHDVGTLRRQLEEMRERLGDWLAPYQVHSATPESGVVDDDAVLAELAALRAIGVTVSGTSERATLERALDLELFDAVQATWNLHERAGGSELAREHAAAGSCTSRRRWPRASCGPRGGAGAGGGGPRRRDDTGRPWDWPRCSTGRGPARCSAARRQWRPCAATSPRLRPGGRTTWNVNWRRCGEQPELLGHRATLPWSRSSWPLARTAPRLTRGLRAPARRQRARHVTRQPGGRPPRASRRRDHQLLDVGHEARTADLQHLHSEQGRRRRHDAGRSRASGTSRSMPSHRARPQHRCSSRAKTSRRSSAWRAWPRSSDSERPRTSRRRSRTSRAGPLNQRPDPVRQRRYPPEARREVNTALLSSPASPPPPAWAWFPRSRDRRLGG